jgi:DNA repair protein RecN (Recombination protein N)
MITEIQIENLGVIERLELMLGPGLTALTGETGAGKTMLVDAIELLVGGRADASVVRSGASEARVDGRLIREDGSETVLTRVIPTSGRSRAYIDGKLATVASLSAAVAASVDLHGQHAHQSLLSTVTQRAALDAYGDVDLEPLRQERARLTEIDAELAALGGDQRARAREIDLLRYQVAELDVASVVDVDEDEALDKEESLLGDAAAHRASGEEAWMGLIGDSGARDAVADSLTVLDGRRPFEIHADRLRNLLAELDDVAAAIRDDTEAIDESPERLAVVRERRQELKNLCRKYGDDLESVMKFHAQATGRLNELEHFDERAAELDAQREVALDGEREAARLVGRKRRKAAPLLAAAVTDRLSDLALPDAAIDIDVGDHADDVPGDRVQFLLAANPGSPLLPLTRVASGGELARAMLALRLVLSAAKGDDKGESTLVFDEVDAGIGGTAAHSIGSALSTLGRDHQVLVVTHLAQVAAAADVQISVSKTVRAGAAFATAGRTEGEDRVAEIARMLSGSSSESAHEHARELLA